MFLIHARPLVIQIRIMRDVMRMGGDSDKTVGYGTRSQAVCNTEDDKNMEVDLQEDMRMGDVTERMTGE